MYSKIENKTHYFNTTDKSDNDILEDIRIENVKYHSKRNLVLSLFLLIIGISISVFLFNVATNAKPAYDKVSVIVSDVKLVLPSKPTQSTYYKVTVWFNGAYFELQNVKNGFSYHKGQITDAYKCNDYIYADLAGVISNTAHAKYYFISLGVNLVLIANFIYRMIIFSRFYRR